MRRKWSVRCERLTRHLNWCATISNVNLAASMNGTSPSQLFSVAVLSPEGDLLATHGRFGLENPEDHGFFQRALRSDQLTLSLPVETEEGTFLYFARGMGSDEASGVIALAVHAGYFVSGYDSTTLGEQGVLGLTGEDDHFRVRRTGEEISVGAPLGIVASEISDVEERSLAPLIEHPWDQTERYTVVRELFEFPLSIVIGLSRTEQLAPARATAREYYWRAALASALLILTVGVLGRLSWRLQKARNHGRTGAARSKSRILGLPRQPDQPAQPSLLQPYADPIHA